MISFNLICHFDDDTYTILTSDPVNIIRFISFLNTLNLADFGDRVSVDMDLLEECKK